MPLYLAARHAARCLSSWSIYAVHIARIATKVSFQFKTTNTKVTLRFGDLFTCKGHIVIPANEFFDSQLGQPVSAKSVHGQFIQRVLGGDSAKFDADVGRSLAGVSGL
jgi:hypothetical protein